jgi:hypothetical protein
MSDANTTSAGDLTRSLSGAIQSHPLPPAMLLLAHHVLALPPLSPTSATSWTASLWFSELLASASAP